MTHVLVTVDVGGLDRTFNAEVPISLAAPTLASAAAIALDELRRRKPRTVIILVSPSRPS